MDYNLIAQYAPIAVPIVIDVLKHFLKRSVKLSRKDEDLENAVQRAAEDFLREAEERGIGEIAEAVLALPSADKSAFQRALEQMLTTHTPDEAIAAVEEELSQVDSLKDNPDLRTAAEIYVRTFRNALWRIPEFRKVATDVLLWQVPQATADEIERRKENRALSKLAWPQKLINPTKLSLSLLKAQAQFVRFVGEERLKERDNLVNWAKQISKGDVGVRIYVGAGGTGKTRLAIEAGNQLAKAGWTVGFLPLKNGDGDVEKILGAEKPLFLVVDYAGGRAGEVERLLKGAARVRGKRRFPVAIILLDRHPTKEITNILNDRTDPDGVGWVEFLESPSVETNPIELSKIREENDRRKIFDEAYSQFLKISDPNVEQIGYEPNQLPDRPLAVIMLALLASQGHRVVKSRDEVTIFRDVWDGWEKGKWKIILRQKGIQGDFTDEACKLIEAAMVAATLGRTFRDAGELAEFWAVHFPQKAFTPTGHGLGRKWLADNLQDLFRTKGELVPEIVPDPLADWIVFQFCVNHDCIISYLDAILPKGKSAVRAALIFHRIFALYSNSYPEEKSIIAKLCKWADARLTPNEAVSVFRAIRKLGPSTRALSEQEMAQMRKSQELLLNNIPLEAKNVLSAIDIDIFKC